MKVNSDKIRPGFSLPTLFLVCGEMAWERLIDVSIISKKENHI